MGGEVYPAPILIPVGSYSQLKVSSELDTEETAYERSIFNELLSGSSRERNTVIHPLNFFPASEFPTFDINEEVPNIGDNCIDRIECELYYEPDWDFVLKAEFTCAEIETKKPCFGTFACVCDNDYKSVSAKMPEPSADKQAELDKLEGVDVDD